MLQKQFLDLCEILWHDMHEMNFQSNNEIRHVSYEKLLSDLILFFIYTKLGLFCI